MSRDQNLPDVGKISLAGTVITAADVLAAFEEDAADAARMAVWEGGQDEPDYA